MNSRIGVCLLLFCLLTTSYSFSQKTENDSSKTSIAPADTTKKHHNKITVKPTTDFDQRFSFFRNSQVNIWGQKVGILLDEELKVGIGGYLLKDKLIGDKVYNRAFPDFYVTRNLYFGTVYVEPFLFRKSWWELSVPFEAGFGKTNLKYFYASNDQQFDTQIKYFIPTGVGLSLSLKLPPGKTFKPFRWIGVNFLAGYRYDLDEHVWNTDYDGAFWSISGAIFLDRVLDDYREWHAKRHPEIKK
jgi:hypothetical protein